MRNSSQAEAIWANGALDAIRDAMSGLEWNADTCETIAEIISGTGRTVEEPVKDPVCRTCLARFEEAGDGFDGECPTRADKSAGRS